MLTPIFERALTSWPILEHHNGSHVRMDVPTLPCSCGGWRRKCPTWSCRTRPTATSPAAHQPRSRQGDSKRGGRGAPPGGRVPRQNDSAAGISHTGVSYGTVRSPAPAEVTRGTSAEPSSSCREQRHPRDPHSTSPETHVQAEHDRVQKIQAAFDARAEKPGSGEREACPSWPPSMGRSRVLSDSSSSSSR